MALPVWILKKQARKIEQVIKNVITLAKREIWVNRQT